MTQDQRDESLWWNAEITFFAKTQVGDLDDFATRKTQANGLPVEVYEHIACQAREDGFFDPLFKGSTAGLFPER